MKNKQLEDKQLKDKQSENKQSEDKQLENEQAEDKQVEESTLWPQRRGRRSYQKFSIDKKTTFVFKYLQGLQLSLFKFTKFAAQKPKYKSTLAQTLKNKELMTLLISPKQILAHADWGHGKCWKKLLSVLLFRKKQTQRVLSTSSESGYIRVNLSFAGWWVVFWNEFCHGS